MAKEKDKFTKEYERLQREIDRDRIREVFAKDADNYIEGLQELGFTWYDDDYLSEEEEENAAVPLNDRQRLLVSYFAGKEKLSTSVLKALQAEKIQKNRTIP